MNWRRVFCALRLHYGHQKAGPFPVKGEEFKWAADDVEWDTSPRLRLVPKEQPMICLDPTLFERTPLFSFFHPTHYRCACGKMWLKKYSKLQIGDFDGSDTPLLRDREMQGDVDPERGPEEENLQGLDR